METVLTILHAGGKFGGGGYKVSSGLHGVGSSVVNALSTRMIAEVRKNGKIYRQEYATGVPQTELEVVGKSDDSGTTITFYPDPTIFKETVNFDYNGLLIIFVIRRTLQKAFTRRLLMSELANEKLSTLRAVFRAM